MLGTRIKECSLDCPSHKAALCERATERGVALEAVFLEKKGFLGFLCVREERAEAVRICVVVSFFFLFSFFLLLWRKGLVFFLADEQKTALCVSVISLPGLAAKLASTAPSVELALRSQCHTEQAASQAAENWLRF